ncbi:hypothetical protein PVMG_02841 [Plasmodium vivax Mauritania I]|uniref:Uncharacterized protein n=1 Tax=Plasmodium vivax Mauritania I TaxID=1035515 RepID=A0A0J9T7N1_PLAVI|nr:hypothetical protein PVMG_02841 [Plasmodium vivax Mauritania I]
MTLNIVQETHEQNENHVQSEEGKKEKIATYGYPSTERRRSDRLLRLSVDKAKLIERNGYSGPSDGTNGGARNVSLKTIVKVKLKERAPSRDRDKLQKGEKRDAQEGSKECSSGGGSSGKTANGVKQNKLVKKVTLSGKKGKTALSGNKGKTTLSDNQGKTTLSDNQGKDPKANKKKTEKGVTVVVDTKKSAPLNKVIVKKKKHQEGMNRAPLSANKKEEAQESKDNPLMGCKMRKGSNLQGKEKEKMQTGQVEKKPAEKGKVEDPPPVKDTPPGEKIKSGADSDCKEEIFLQKRLKMRKAACPNGANGASERRENKRKLNRIPEIINIKKQKFVIGSSNRKCDLVLRGNIEGEQCELVCKCVEKNINHCSDRNRQINKYNLFIINKSRSNSTLLNNSVVDIDQVKDEDSLFLGIENMEKSTSAKYIYKIKYNKMANIFNINNLCSYSKDNCIHKTLITNAEDGKASKIVSTNFSLNNQNEEQESNISILIFLIIKRSSIPNEPVHYMNSLNSFANLNSTPRKLPVEDKAMVGKASTSVNKMIKEDSPNTQFNESIKKINKICQSRISPLCVKDSIKKEEKVKGTFKSANHTKELPVTLLNACVELCKEINKSVTKEHAGEGNHDVPAGTPVMKYPSLTPTKGMTLPNGKRGPHTSNLYNIFHASFATPRHGRSSTGETISGTTDRVTAANNVAAVERERVSTSGDRVNGLQCQGPPISRASKSLNQPNISEEAHLHGNSQHNTSDKSKSNLHKLGEEIFPQGNTSREGPSEEGKNGETDYATQNGNVDGRVFCPPPIDQHARVYCEDVDARQAEQIGEEIHEEELNISADDSLLVNPGKGAHLVDNNQMTFYDCKDEKAAKEAAPLLEKPNGGTNMVIKTSESSEFIKKTEKELYSVLYSKSSENTTNGANTDFVLCLKNEQGEERYLKVIGEIKVKRNAILSDIKHNIDLKLLDKSIELTTLNKINYLKCESLSKGKYSIRLNAFSDKLDETKFGEFSALHLDYIDNTNFSHLDTLEPLELKKMLFIKYDE